MSVFIGKQLHALNNFEFKSISNCLRNTTVGFHTATSCIFANCLGFGSFGKFKLHLLVRSCFLNSTTLTISGKHLAPTRYEAYRVGIFRLTKNYYRGLCHERGLPVRGQRTRSNYRTQAVLASRRYSGSFRVD